MSKPLNILIAIAVIIVAVFLIFNLINSFKLPLNETPPGQSKGKWKEFTSPSGNFKALLPNIPQHATDTIPDSKTKEPRKYDTYISTPDIGPIYMISTITFPHKIAEGQKSEILKGIVDDMLARNKETKQDRAEFKDISIKNIGNTKALEFNLTNGDMIIAGKVFAKDNTVYILSTVSHHDTFNQNDIDDFTKTFTVEK